MNSNRQVEIHYINTGLPYTATESFMDLFEGLTYVQTDASALAGALQQDQGSSHWPMMHTNGYKYGYSGPTTSNYYYNFSHTYEVSDHSMRLDFGRRVWDSPSIMGNEQLTSQVLHVEVADAGDTADLEECIRAQNNTIHQVFWQDNIDPDNMTYEELLDLGETVGTQSRGLSQELISSLPVSKYKCRLFTWRRNKAERCVVCQMEYKRGDRQMTLPCKHVYHAGCVSQWLGINKVCPVCFVEVLGDDSRGK